MDLLINLGSILYLPRVMQPTAEARPVVAGRSICVGRAMPLMIGALRAQYEKALEIFD